MMNSNMFLLLLVGATTVLTWALVGLLVRLAPRLGLLDRPNERSSHTRVTPRGGGIGFVVTIELAAGVAWLVLRHAGADAGTAAMFGVLGAALFVAAISLWDDFRSLTAGLRFLCHLTAAIVAVRLLASLAVWAIPGGVLHLAPVAAVAVTLVWIVGLTNVYNFMDGIDGIAGVQGVCAGLAWSVAGYCLGQPAVTGCGGLLAAGCAGFLVHNWSPAKIFMGDVGSAFLGFLFAVLPLLAVAGAGDGALSPATAARLPAFGVLVVWPFVGDGALTLVRRALKREPVWKAHRSHLYQRLVQTGWSHAQVSGWYAVWAVVCAATGGWWLSGRPGAAVLVLAVPVGTLAAMFGFVSAQEVLGTAKPPRKP